MAVPVETGGGRLSVGSVTKVVTVQFIRPANTTQYTANDVVGPNATTGGALTFPGCARFPGGTGVIYSALLFDSVDAATNANFDLALFDTNSLTVAADNAAGTITDAELLNCVAVITFDGTNAANVSTLGPNLVIGATAIGQAFKCNDSTQDLYGVVVDRGGYTPASAEVFAFKLYIIQD